MQLDHLKKELSRDEQEILQTFKKTKSTQNNVMMVLACCGVIVLGLLAVRFSGVINQQ
jgi:Mg2+ and Co2+ transporter CorA